jgi:hypothetical protein
MASFAVLGSEARRLAASNDLNSKDQVSLTLAAGLTSAVACELVSGVVVLTEARVAYGAAALVRQLVEAEYVSWAVTQDPDDALDWLTSSKKVRMAKLSGSLAVSATVQSDASRTRTMATTVRLAVIPRQKAPRQSSTTESCGWR